VSAVGRFSHITPDLRWYGPSRYEFRDTFHNRVFNYTTSTGILVKPRLGMITDLGSLPLFFTRVFPRDEFAPAFVLHDGTFDCGKWVEDGPFITLTESNWMLRDAIVALCVQNPALKWRAWKRFPVHMGVAVGGWYSWNKHNDGRPKAFPYWP